MKNIMLKIFFVYEKLSSVKELSTLFVYILCEVAFEEIFSHVIGIIIKGCSWCILNSSDRVEQTGDLRID